jgi:methanesulfonate monooxygenase small subunit
MSARAADGAELDVSASEAIERGVRALIYRGCLLLDGNDFAGWLDLCAPDFRYTISAYSPEIRKDQTWLDHDLEGMRHLVNLLPKHNSDQTPLTRHATVYTIDHDRVSRRARAVTSVAIFATALDGGETTLFALARYHDVVDLAGPTPQLQRRVVRLETRSLGIGKHWPL